MLLHQALSSTDISIDWTAIALGIIATIGTTFTAIFTRKTNRRIRTNSGKTIGQHVEGIASVLAETLKQVEKTLEEARLVRDHEAIESVINKSEYKKERENLEIARRRVHDELERLNSILNRLSPPKQEEQND
jgi:Na+-translocating ferredoxin:NAD+ oxidoreductase RnfG subunit